MKLSVVLFEISLNYISIHLLSLKTEAETNQAFDVSACKVLLLMKQYCVVSAPSVWDDRTQY